MRLLLAALLAAPLGAAHAAPFFAVRNEALLARGFALPTLGEIERAPNGAGWFDASIDLSNEYEQDQNARESLLLDGETLNLGLSYRRGFGARGEWGIRVPFYDVSGGTLDSAIESWHGFWGLPNGGRERAPQDRLQYTYVRDGVTQFDRRDGGSALGDVQLLAGWQAGEHWLLRTQLKLPTGDEAKLAGNGAVGLAVWAERGFEAGRWSGYLSAGADWTADGDPLPDQQRNFVPLGGAGLAWQGLSWLRLIGQVYAHGPLYTDSDLRALQNPGFMLALGGALRLTPQIELLLGFQEDPSVAVSPDFSLHFQLSLR